MSPGPRTEPHHLLVGGQDLEPVVGESPRHDQMERVGANVHGGQNLVAWDRRIDRHGSNPTQGLVSQPR